MNDRSQTSMIHAFAETFGVVMGLIIAIICGGGLIWAGMSLLDRWLARVQRQEYQRNPWSDECVPAIWDTKPDDLPRLPPREEIESWWVPIDHWDNKP